MDGKAKKWPATLDDFARMSDRQRDERTNALRALALARRAGISINRAASEVDSSVDEVRVWAGGAIKKRKGKYFPKKSDELPRLRPLYVEGDIDFVVVGGSDEAAEAEQIFDAQWAFINGEADRRELEPFEGRWIGGRLVETDPEVLIDIGERGEADPIDRYREMFG